VVWGNPVNGEEALYLASHAFAVEGLPEAEGQKLIDELIAFATRAGSIYTDSSSEGNIACERRSTVACGRMDRVRKTSVWLWNKSLHFEAGTSLKLTSTMAFQAPTCL
jgi:hypothetical protein